MTNHNYKRLVLINLVLVFLVIAAGAFVRMTGSGMGCPDWPKCFGYLIPPTERAQLEWKPQHQYKEGQVIIINESLRVVKKDFNSNDTFDETQWAPYTKHDYSVFNVYHTWIEFINRLLGALAGLATFGLLLASGLRWKQSKSLFMWSFLVVLGMGFQAWLGKTVVDSNLLPVKITIHMAMALLIVAFLIVLWDRVQPEETSKNLQKRFVGLTFLALLLSLIQIAMGTQIRQFVDTQMHQWNLLQPEKWLLNSPLVFYIHRSFSLLILGVNGFLGWQLWKNKMHNPTLYWIIGCIGLEMITGASMYYFDFPIASQPIHLVLAALLFATQFYILLQQKPLKVRK
ncbi:MAG: Heme A synthase [Flavobacteriaceae bacterium]|nr:MAG: Heme A synthase [Flavobacteriaceae bacterium]|tara:strand:- start:21988 stop:23016 length:1029 start_codon:yes stop_codon:yes gene_type:complete